MTSLLGLEQQQQQKSFLLFLSSLREYAPPPSPEGYHCAAQEVIHLISVWYVSTQD